MNFDVAASPVQVEMYRAGACAPNRGDARQFVVYAAGVAAYSDIPVHQPSAWRLPEYHEHRERCFAES